MIPHCRREIETQESEPGTQCTPAFRNNRGFPQRVLVAKLRLRVPGAASAMP
jgi:hypothetical protein